MARDGANEFVRRAPTIARRRVAAQREANACPAPAKKSSHNLAARGPLLSAAKEGRNCRSFLRRDRAEVPQTDRSFAVPSSRFGRGATIDRRG